MIITKRCRVLPSLCWVICGERSGWLEVKKPRETIQLKVTVLSSGGWKWQEKKAVTFLNGNTGSCSVFTDVALESDI